MHKILLSIVFISLSWLITSIDISHATENMKASPSTIKMQEKMMKERTVSVWKISPSSTSSTGETLLSVTPSNSVLEFIQAVINGPCKPPYLCNFLMVDSDKDGVTDEIHVISARLKAWQLMQGKNSTQTMRTNEPTITKDIDNRSLITGPCKPPYMCDFSSERSKEEIRLSASGRTIPTEMSPSENKKFPAGRSSNR